MARRMLGDDDDRDGARVSTFTALRHVLVFQLKLAADAFRDFLLSPLSIVAFVLDAIRKPRVEKSLYLRLMLLGRRSDRFINLFDDHRDGGAFTIDHAVDELEELVRGSAGAGASSKETGEGASEEKA